MADALGPFRRNPERALLDAQSIAAIRVLAAMRRYRLVLGWDEVEGFGLADVDQAVRIADTLRDVISLAFLEVIRPWPKHDLLLSCFGVGHRPLHDHPVVVAGMQMHRADEAFG